MASQLPTFPRIVFTVVEPLSLIAGAVGALADPDWFIASQMALETDDVTNNSNSARLVALQLGNLYGLIFLFGVAVLSTTSELKVVRAYLAAAWAADLSHVALTCWLLGWPRAVDVAAWNATTWGNVGFTMFLCLTRTAWFLGLFGPNSDPQPASRTSAQKKTA